MKSNTVRTSGRSSGIDDKHNWDSIRVGQFGKGGQGDRVYSPEGKSVNLSALGGGRGAKTGLYLIDTRQMSREKIPRIYNKGKTPTLNGSMYKDPYKIVMVQTPRGKNKGGLRALDGKTPVLTRSEWQHNNKLTDGTFIRKLTPVECERLQGLPDNYTEGISNSQRYKALGNAFNVDVIAH